MGILSTDVRPPMNSTLIVESVLLIQDPVTDLGSSIVESFVCRRKKPLEHIWAHKTWQTSRAKKRATKSEQTLGHPFLEVLQTKSKGKHSHKGGCPQEALILLNVTVLGSSLVLQLFFWLLKKRSLAIVK